MHGAEPLAGSAMPARRMLFITWPKTLWVRRELEARDFPPSLRSYLRHAQHQLEHVDVAFPQFQPQAFGEHPGESLGPGINGVPPGTHVARE